MTGIDTYYAEIANCSGISTAHERVLCDRIQAGCREALDELVSANLLFVVSVATRFSGCGLPLEDLISEGNLGLIRAAEKFDASKGYRFITYAVSWIRAYIQAFIANQSRIVRLPQNQNSAVQKMAKASNRLEQSLGHTPRYELAADATGVDLNLASDLLGADTRGTSLDEPVAPGATQLLHETISDQCISVDDKIAELAMQEQLSAAISRLSPVDARVLIHYYGLQGHAPQTLEAVGRAEGVSRERIRQIKKRALTRLYKKIPALRDHLRAS